MLSAESLLPVEDGLNCQKMPDLGARTLTMMTLSAESLLPVEDGLNCEKMPDLEARTLTI